MPALTVAEMIAVLTPCDPTATVRVLPEGALWEPQHEHIITDWQGVLRDNGKRTVTLFTKALPAPDAAR